MGEFHIKEGILAFAIFWVPIFFIARNFIKSNKATEQRYLEQMEKIERNTK